MEFPLKSSGSSREIPNAGISEFKPRVSSCFSRKSRDSVVHFKCPSVGLFYQSVYHYQSVNQSVSQSVTQSVSLSVSLSVRLSASQSVSQSISQFISQFVSQSVSQSVSQFIHRWVEPIDRLPKIASNVATSLGP